MKTKDNPPSRWLQGRCLILERHHSVNPREAIEQALAEWREQSQMEAEHVNR